MTTRPKWSGPLALLTSVLSTVIPPPASAAGVMRARQREEALELGPPVSWCGPSARNGTRSRGTAAFKRAAAKRRNRARNRRAHR